MSTLRNSIPSRPYRERPQPHSRVRSHPLLEKRKDYRLRAADHKAKQTRLKALRSKASSRNPDEFSFSMLSAGRAGSAKKRGVGNTGGAGEEDLEERVRREVGAGKGLRMETVKLLKTQDARFVRTVRGRVRRERERLEGGVVLGDGAVGVLGGGERRAGRRVWVESGEEARGFGRGIEEDRKGESALDGDLKVTKQTEEQRQAKKLDQQWREKEQAKQRAKLEALKTQDEELGKAERELELQRARMQGDMGGVNKNGVKWKVKQRKR